MIDKNHEDETLPVPRKRVFVLDDGTFVVQWEAHRVQSLLSGRYFQYKKERFGAAISDYELNQLRNNGTISHYDDELVYLSPQPNTIHQLPTRSYYLNTRLPKSERYNVENALSDADLLEKFAVRVQEIFVIIRGESGMPFVSFDDAERAREYLVAQLPHIFEQTVVAFMEINNST